MKAMTPWRGTPMHRHQLAWLSETGWARWQADRTDELTRECVDHWAMRRLPLVVTRQPEGLGRDTIVLGLAAPHRWGRRRLTLRVAADEVMRYGEFPRVELAQELVPVAARTSWGNLCAQLHRVDITARVYGSYGWQLLSGLEHVDAGSDIDLWLAVASADQADTAAACLQSFSCEALRLDGELTFADGTAVAWREWLNWRAGLATAVLIKTLHGASLVTARQWQRTAPALAPT